MSAKQLFTPSNLLGRYRPRFSPYPVDLPLGKDGQGERQWDAYDLTLSCRYAWPGMPVRKKIENTARHLGVDVEDALLLAERTEVRL